MSERRYSDEEVAEIFKVAAESQQTSRPQLTPGEGMTLQQIQEIGREVGIAPEQLATASRAVGFSVRPSSRQFLGLPVGVGMSVDLNRKLSDAEWERLVVDLRETFDARGKQRQEGSLRQWTNGNLQALLEPTASGDRFRIRTVKGDAQMLVMGGIGLLGYAAFLTLSALARSRAIDFGLFTGVGTIAAIGVALLGFGGLTLPRWARTRREQMQSVATRLALSAGSDRPTE